MKIFRRRNEFHPFLIVQFPSGVKIKVHSPVGLCVEIYYTRGRVKVEGIGVTRREAFRDLRLNLRLRTDKKFREVYTRINA